MALAKVRSLTTSCCSETILAVDYHGHLDQLIEQDNGLTTFSFLYSITAQCPLRANLW